MNNELQDEIAAMRRMDAQDARQAMQEERDRGVMTPFQPHLNVNNEGRPNGERADSAFVALTKHYQRVNACRQFPFVELEDAVTDLLTDLEHLCHRDGISFANCTRIARSHFEIESVTESGV